VIGRIETASNITVAGATVQQETVSTSKHFSILSQRNFNDPQINANEGHPLRSSDDVFVFVHGFNTPFDLALFRAAALAWDTSFAGAAAVFSWPSAGSVSGYMTDRDAALKSRIQFKAFIRAVRSRYHGRMHIIAESLGVLPVMWVLDEIALEQVGSVAQIDELILVGPDAENNNYRVLCPGLLKVARRITVYASARDKGLQIAEKLWNAPRLGSIGLDGIPFVGSCGDFIDASNTSYGSALRADGNYFSKAVLDDISRLLNGPVLRPDERLADIRKIESPKGPFFRYVN
jgi:esterase/lipase superfamily enzyme